MRHDILNETVWPRVVREVRDDGQRAGGHQLSGGFRHQVMQLRISQYPLPQPFNLRGDGPPRVHSDAGDGRGSTNPQAQSSRILRMTGEVCMTRYVRLIVEIHLSLSMSLGIRFSWWGVNLKGRKTAGGG